MNNYIACEKQLYQFILDFLEDSDQTSQKCFTIFCENLSNYHFEGDKEEMTQFLLIIKNIMENHHRDAVFTKKIKSILHHYKDQIKQTLSNNEIFHIFESDKLIILFLLKSKIINISEEIYDCIQESTDKFYCHFFYPELKKLKGKEQTKNIKEEILSQYPSALEDFESKRQEGENDSFICSLIRKDSIEEFITYITRNNISFSSQIQPSLFETNSFLIENKKPHLLNIQHFSVLFKFFNTY